MFAFLLSIHLYPSLENCCPIGFRTTQRADSKQSRGSVSQTARNPQIDTHILKALFKCPKNAPKTGNHISFPQVSVGKMTGNIQTEYAVYVTHNIVFDGGILVCM